MRLCTLPCQDLLLRLSPDALDMAAWVGLLQPALPDPSGSGGGSPASQLESLLRFKCLLLVAVALRLRAFRWAPAASRVRVPCSLNCFGA